MHLTVNLQLVPLELTSPSAARQASNKPFQLYTKKGPPAGRRDQ